MSEWKKMDSAPLSYYKQEYRGNANKGGKKSMKTIFHAKQIYTVSKCRQIILSYWIPESEDEHGKKSGARWHGYGSNETPLLWCNINLPENIEELAA